MYSATLNEEPIKFRFSSGKGIRFRDNGANKNYAFKSNATPTYEDKTFPYTMKVELEDWPTADYPDAPFVEYESELEFVTSITSI